ncbi:MAG TPA: hypothetical protein VFM18_17710 [Methanosarcina sp.]|nr:hypothetical protein [Methanosarcina sp.]
MIPTIVDFILGIALSPLFFGGLLILGILFEHNAARGWAIFTGLIATVVAYFTFQIPLIDIAYGLAAYIALGVVWSFYRYKRHVMEEVRKVEDKDDAAKRYVIRELHPSAMLGTITAWILIWPFSIIDNLIGDVINAVETLVRTVFRGVYHRIYENAVEKLVGSSK